MLKESSHKVSDGVEEHEENEVLCDTASMRPSLFGSNITGGVCFSRKWASNNDELVKVWLQVVHI